MSEQLTCPVCERSGVPPDSKKCPQCDADLTCFQALDTLAEQKKLSAAEGLAVSAKMAEKEERASNRRTVLLLLLLLVLIGSGFLFYALKAQEHVHDLKQRVFFLKTDLLVAEQNVEQAQKMLCVLPESEKMGVAEEDTFEEDDPLVYAEDLDAEASSGDSAKDHVITAGSAARKESETGQRAGGRQHPVQAEERNNAAGLIVEAAESESEMGVEVGGEENNDVERNDNAERAPVVVVEAVSRKLEIGRFSEDMSAKAEEPPIESLPLLPEERWSERTFLYLIKETDTLWGLAERFYGDGKYYPVIMEQNPGLVISNIHDEEILRLFNERTVLEDIYKRRIEWRDGLVLWKHKVGPGETRQGIEDRFASPGSSGRVFYEKAPDIQSGATVRIILH